MKRDIDAGHPMTTTEVLHLFTSSPADTPFVREGRSCLKGLRVMKPISYDYIYILNLLSVLLTTTYLP
jgi:hypothetical protein